VSRFCYNEAVVHAPIENIVSWSEADDALEELSAMKSPKPKLAGVKISIKPMTKAEVDKVRPKPSAKGWTKGALDKKTMG
jgi:hypothetical protein